MSSEIRKKFGLDYLIRDKSGSSDSSLSSDKQIELALLTVGSSIIKTLKSSPEHGARLYDLVDATGYELETLLPVVNRLESLNLISYDQRDKLGNHHIVLTPAGLNASS